MLLLAGVSEALMTELQKAGVLDKIGAENVFAAQSGLGAAEDAALEAAQKWLGSHPEEATQAEDADQPSEDGNSE